jgi:phage/plasmid-associated DNA primase
VSQFLKGVIRVDFYQIKEKSIKSGVIEVYPDFKVVRSKDLMVRGRSFYAIWDEETQMWSTDEYDVQRLVDKDLLEYKNQLANRTEASIQVKYMSDFSSRSWSSFRNFMQNISDNSHQLDEKLTFINTETKKKDYVSRRLPYPLEEGGIESYKEIVSTLYDTEEKDKLEWAIGAIVAGDAKDIQKFIVLYGEAGAGKSTMLNIIQKLFTGYYTTFEAKALTSSNNSFSTEVFKSNPLVAIQHDGDLSKIEDNTKLNSIISHEEMTMNEKYKPSYMARVNCFLFMATNRPVKITDAKSGIIRRLIDVRPSGRKIPSKRYHALMQQIDFELGGIAYHCLEKYREMGKNYYASYRPLDMILQTDVFFNFVEANYYTFKDIEGITLTRAYDMYKKYCDESLVEFKYPRHKFREEFKNYFYDFHEVKRIDGKQIRSYYSGFITDKFKSVSEKTDEKPFSLVLDLDESIFDELRKDSLAQYATSNGVPNKKWEAVNTTLENINTTLLHYVKLPQEHIVIDFDIKDEKGNKSLEKNLEAASKWPVTYAELSKSGKGVHLHYIYDGDVNKLSRVYNDDIEVKVFTGKSSLRRKLTKCNNIPLATINSGLPLKGERMVNTEVVKNEVNLRNLIKRNLNKEIHPGTKPSIDFIHKILEDAYNSGLVYDVTDMRPDILIFANNSSNQAMYCIKLTNKMKFKSEVEAPQVTNVYSEDEVAFYDVEVFPNLFIVVWKFKGKKKVKMINPTSEDIEKLLSLKLVGFNCRRYDNHILYARYIGYTNEQLYSLSQKIIKGSANALFREAYNISYTDVYDFSSKKQSLKKFQIELGIHHQELGFNWEDPVPEEMWDLVATYCGNDVDATEAVFEDRQQDFVARLILSELSGLSPNDTTQQHTAKIIFGNDPKPQEKFEYTDLSKDFPGYVFEHGKSLYKGEDPGEGGYVYAEPGIYSNVALLDVVSMHPTSLINMNMFGPYTNNFKQLLDARIAIKRKNFKTAEHMLNGILVKYLDNEEQAEALSYALKIVINIVYGLTSAKFENKFKDPRNRDNIVAKRGALFMIDLKQAVQEKGITVAHIKTDSIKIPNASKETIKFIIDFGRKYGYEFEHEDTFEKMCLVNDAVYIAKNKEHEWSATGAQFAHPYVFKTLFSKEPILFEDYCEIKSVSTALYLNMNENLDVDAYHFIGKIGEFAPIKPGKGGGTLLREKEGKYYAVTGTKGYRWLESEMIKTLKKEKDIDFAYHSKLVDEAVANISRFGDFEEFIS